MCWNFCLLCKFYQLDAFWDRLSPWCQGWRRFAVFDFDGASWPCLTTGWKELTDSRHVGKMRSSTGRNIDWTAEDFFRKRKVDAKK